MATLRLLMFPPLVGRAYTVHTYSMVTEKTNIVKSMMHHRFFLSLKRQNNHDERYKQTIPMRVAAGYINNRCRGATLERKSGQDALYGKPA